MCMWGKTTVAPSLYQRVNNLEMLGLNLMASLHCFNDDKYDDAGDGNGSQHSVVVIIVVVVSAMQ